eukprot:gene24039-29173_t
MEARSRAPALLDPENPEAGLAPPPDLGQCHFDMGYEKLKFKHEDKKEILLDLVDGELAQQVRGVHKAMVQAKREAEEATIRQLTGGEEPQPAEAPAPAIEDPPVEEVASQPEPAAAASVEQ